MIKIPKRNPLTNLNDLFDSVKLIQDRHGDKIYKVSLNKDSNIGKLKLKKGNYIYKELENSLRKGERESIFSKIEKLLNIWHNFGIGHGDLHTGNIIIDAYNNIYLIDPYLIDYDRNFEIYNNQNVWEDKKYINKVRRELLGK